MVLDSDAKESGIVYLEHQAIHLELPKGSGRIWKIFGSPVGFAVQIPVFGRLT
jgi:hypothetical protein